VDAQGTAPAPSPAPPEPGQELAGLLDPFHGPLRCAFNAARGKRQAARRTLLDAVRRSPAAATTTGKAEGAIDACVDKLR